MANFIEDCLAGSTRPGDIDEYIDRWHEGASPLPLRTYLGLSLDEYAQWLETPEALPTILDARRQNQP